VVVGLLAVSVLAVSCALVPLPVPAPSEDQPGSRPGDGSAPVPSCAAASVRSCALPYPSDEFTVPADTPTGRRVVLPSELIAPAVLDQLGAGARPSDVFDGADGFASVSPVVFELDRPVHPGLVPEDGGDLVRVFDAATGAPVPVRVAVSRDSLRQGAPDTVVFAWPRVRFEPGRTYVARITTAAPARAGSVVRAPGVTSLSSPFLASVRADLARIEGDRWSEVVGATRFTVRSSANATSVLDSMATAVRAADHPVRDLQVLPPLFVPQAAAVVRGEVRVTDFRDGDGVVRVDRPPVGRWIPFLLVLPSRPAGPNGAPVMIYGHGLTVAKETMLISAGLNAELGIATIGIDIPNHGDRQADSGGYLLDLVSPQQFGRLASMPLQGVVDQIALIEAVRTHLGTVDAAPWRLDGTSGDGVADLDTSRILYSGTSMGGVLGASFVALAPELAGAYLEVAGSGIGHTIFDSILWVVFAGVVPFGATAGDAAALTAASVSLLDRADNVNLVDRLRQGPPVLLQYGVGDAIVPAHSSERLVSLLDLPLIGRELVPMATPTPVRRIPGDDIPDDGWGVAQVWNTAFAEDLQGFGGHVSFLDPAARSLYRSWLVNRLGAMGLPIA
jgi:hypothetical protein